MAKTLFNSQAYTVTTNSSAVGLRKETKGGIFTLDITAVSGTTPSMTVKLQHLDQVSGQYVDIPGASFAAKTATGTDTLQVYPGIVATANRSVPLVLGDAVRAVATISGTTPSFTMTLSFQAVY